MRISVYKLGILGMIIIIVSLASGCTDSNSQNNSTNNSNLIPIVLDEEGTIPLEYCEKRNLTDKVIVLESQFCGACRVAVPRLKEIEQELGEEFLFFDLSVAEDREKMNEFYIIPRYTPTILIGCDIHIGAKSKEEFKSAIEEFLAK